MTLIIFILLLLALVSLKARKANRRFLVVLVSCYWLVGSGILPILLCQPLETFVSRQSVVWGQRNAIIVLGAGVTKWPSHHIDLGLNAYSRIFTATQLYDACRQQSKADCVLILSGGDALQAGLSEAKIYERALTRLGIDPQTMILEPNSLNTYENAAFVHRILKDQTFDKIVLVTSALHLKRAILYFSQMGLHPQPIAADYWKPGFSFFTSGYNFYLTDMALHEWLGIARLSLYNYFGWQAEKITQLFLT